MLTEKLFFWANLSISADLKSGMFLMKALTCNDAGIGADTPEREDALCFLTLKRRFIIELLC